MAFIIDPILIYIENVLYTKTSILSIYLIWSVYLFCVHVQVMLVLTLTFIQCHSQRARLQCFLSVPWIITKKGKNCSLAPKGKRNIFKIQISYDEKKTIKFYAFLSNFHYLRFILELLATHHTSQKYFMLNALWKSHSKHEIVWNLFIKNIG